MRVATGKYLTEHYYQGCENTPDSNAASGFNDAGIPLVLGQAVAAGSDDWDADDDEL